MMRVLRVVSKMAPGWNYFQGASTGAFARRSGLLPPGAGRLQDQLLMGRACFMGKMKLLENKQRRTVINREGFGQGAVNDAFQVIRITTTGLFQGPGSIYVS